MFRQDVREKLKVKKNEESRVKVSRTISAGCSDNDADSSLAAGRSELQAEKGGVSEENKGKSREQRAVSREC